MNGFAFCRKIWFKTLTDIHGHLPLYYFYRAIEQQLKEIDGHIRDSLTNEFGLPEEYYQQKIVNEYCDIIAIAQHAIEDMGYDAEKTYLLRLSKRHLGQTQAIIKKYNPELIEYLRDEKS